MYDFDSLPEANRGISTTFGPPALCGGGIDPNSLGDEVAVWDLEQRKVIQTADLGPNSGALEVRFIEDEGVRRAFINTPGTSAVWLAHDDDGDGVYAFDQVLGPETASCSRRHAPLLRPQVHVPDELVRQHRAAIHISDPFDPRLTATASVPHPNMLRLSRDNRRLYVSNSLLSTWDNDTRFGPARNGDYGIWRFDVGSGGLTSSNSDGSAWVSFTSVAKQTTTGPAGPHMMVFDPGIELAPGEHCAIRQDPTPMVDARKLVLELEAGASPAALSGWEQFSGYAVVGVPFRSGHILGTRRFPVSSVGPGYTSVWHRDPDGRWVIHQDQGPAVTCPRAFGPAIDDAPTVPVAVDWVGSDCFAVDIETPGKQLHWEVRLAESAITRLLGTTASIPARRSPSPGRAGSRVLATAAPATRVATVPAQARGGCGRAASGATSSSRRGAASSPARVRA